MIQETGAANVESALEMFARRHGLSERRDQLAMELEAVDLELGRIEDEWGGVCDGLSIDALLSHMASLVEENRRLREGAVPGASPVVEPVAALPVSVLPEARRPLFAPAPQESPERPGAAGAEVSASVPPGTVAGPAGGGGGPGGTDEGEPGAEKQKRGYYADKQFEAGYKDGGIHRKAGVEATPGRGRGNVYRGYMAGYADMGRGVDDWEAAFAVLMAERAPKAHQAGEAPGSDQVEEALADDGRSGGPAFLGSRADGHGRGHVDGHGDGEAAGGPSREPGDGPDGAAGPLGDGIDAVDEAGGEDFPEVWTDPGEGGEGGEDGEGDGAEVRREAGAPVDPVDLGAGPL